MQALYGQISNPDALQKGDLDYMLEDSALYIWEG